MGLGDGSPRSLPTATYRRSPSTVTRLALAARPAYVLRRRVGLAASCGQLQLEPDADRADLPVLRLVGHAGLGGSLSILGSAGILGVAIARLFPGRGRARRGRDRRVNRARGPRGPVRPERFVANRSAVAT